MKEKKPVPGWIYPAAAVFWLVIWQIAYQNVGSDLLLSSPLSVLKRLGQLVIQGSFWMTILRSLSRILQGLIMGIAAGFLLGWASGKAAVVRPFISLPMAIIKATPVASFVILALVWLSGRNLSIFIVFMMVTPIIWAACDEGFRNPDPLLKEMSHVYRLSYGKRFLHLELPAVKTLFLTSLKVAIGFAFKSGIAGEVIAIPKGTIGTQLHNAKVYLETTDLFAWTVVIILLSVLIEKGFSKILDLVARRGGEAA